MVGGVYSLSPFEGDQLDTSLLIGAHSFWIFSPGSAFKTKLLVSYVYFSNTYTLIVIEYLLVLYLWPFHCALH